MRNRPKWFAQKIRFRPANFDYSNNQLFWKNYIDSRNIEERYRYGAIAERYTANKG